MINGRARSWFSDNAQLAIDTLAMKSVKGIPHGMIHVMDIPFLEELADVSPGEYRADPKRVYYQMQVNTGTGFIDQFVPFNPLTMGEHGYESDKERGATTGAEEIVRDGIVIDSPEAVVEHMETIVFPDLEQKIEELRGSDTTQWRQDLIAQEHDCQKDFGPAILKSPYNRFQGKPVLRYGVYGYVNYFMAYALYPEIWEKDFKLQADFAEECNRVSAAAIVEGGLPPVVRFDHDMADSRSTLVDIASLDKIWFPQFARCIKPLLDAGIRIIWHCDGNLMQMVPRLLECGLGGFQGFQYEDGMDYEKICAMTDRNGDPLFIWAGVSVTTTLPHGSKADVAKQVKWLVDNGPEVGLVLGPSSSIAPGTNRDNVRTMLEGFAYYREHGRG